MIIFGKSHLLKLLKEKHFSIENGKSDVITARKDGEQYILGENVGYICGTETFEMSYKDAIRFLTS